jgi:hypothetical protein
MLPDAPSAHPRVCRGFFISGPSADKSIWPRSHGASCRSTNLARAHAGGNSRGLLHARCSGMAQQSRIWLDRNAAMRANKPGLEIWLLVPFRCGSPPLAASISELTWRGWPRELFYISRRPFAPAGIAGTGSGSTDANLLDDAFAIEPDQASVRALDNFFAHLADQSRSPK